MVKPADARQRDDVAIVRPLDRSPGGRVSVERHVGPVIVVEPDAVANEPEQMPLTEGGRERGLRLGMYRATVSLADACPSLASSLAMRRRLTSGCPEPSAP